MFLRVKPKKSSIKFGKGAKLSPRFVGPFEILERIGLVAYRIDFSSSLHRIHNVFHVSVLRHYVRDGYHVINLSNVQIKDEDVMTTEPI